MALMVAQNGSRTPGSIAYGGLGGLLARQSPGYNRMDLLPGSTTGGGPGSGGFNGDISPYQPTPYTPYAPMQPTNNPYPGGGAGGYSGGIDPNYTPIPDMTGNLQGSFADFMADIWAQQRRRPQDSPIAQAAAAQAAFGNGGPGGPVHFNPAAKPPASALPFSIPIPGGGYIGAPPLGAGPGAGAAPTGPAFATPGHIQQQMDQALAFKGGPVAYSAADLSAINGAVSGYKPYSYERVAAPTTIALNGKDQAQVRGMQMSNLDQLRMASLGQGPSAAQAQLQRGADANISQQMAVAAAARGVSGGAAQRNARNQAALIQQRTGQEATALRNVEMQQAQGQYAGALQGTRGQDMTWAGQQADVGFQNNAQRMQQQMSNQQAGLAANQQNNSYYSGLLGMQLQGNTANMNASLQSQSLGLQAQAQNQQYILGLGGQQYQYTALNQSDAFAREQLAQQAQLAREGYINNIAAAQASGPSVGETILGGVINAAGQVGAGYFGGRR